MEDNNKVYAFTITMYEYRATIPTLWDTVTNFVQENPQYVAENNAMGYMSDDSGKSYNLCHCECLIRRFRVRRPCSSFVALVWSNFEIADMDFWRGEAYSKFFEYLDQTGGFYYEVRPLSILFTHASFGSNTNTHCSPLTTTAMGRCARTQHRSLIIPE